MILFVSFLSKIHVGICQGFLTGVSVIFLIPKTTSLKGESGPLISFFSSFWKMDTRRNATEASRSSTVRTSVTRSWTFTLEYASKRAQMLNRAGTRKLNPVMMMEGRKFQTSLSASSRVSVSKLVNNTASICKENHFKKFTEYKKYEAQTLDVQDKLFVIPSLSRY